MISIECTSLAACRAVICAAMVSKSALPVIDGIAESQHGADALQNRLPSRRCELVCPLRDRDRLLRRQRDIAIIWQDDHKLRLAHDRSQPGNLLLPGWRPAPPADDGAATQVTVKNGAQSRRLLQTAMTADILSAPMSGLILPGTAARLP